MNEAQIIAVMCAFWGGEPEVSLDYMLHGEARRVQIDCLTEERAIELGLDKRSSLDSVQQATFAADLADRSPQVVIIDTNGEQGSIEYRIQRAAKLAGVGFNRVPVGLVYRIWMTTYLRGQMVE